MNARIFFPAIVVAFSVACGGASAVPEPTPEPTSTSTATAQPTNTKVPAPTATLAGTPTRTAAQKVDRVMLDIATVRFTSAILDAQLGFVADGKDLARDVENLRESCARVSDTPVSYSDHDDLWPQVYEDLDRQVAVTCKLFRAELEKTPIEDGNVTWVAFGKVHQSIVRKAYNSLPDLSDPQLKRAIEDRQ